MNKNPMQMSQSELTSDIQWMAYSQQNVTRSPKRASPQRGGSPRKGSPRKGSPGRLGSPTRYHLNESVYDPDVNRALARELYVDSTVNVVNPSSRASPGKVRPGQMNLFNPKADLTKSKEIIS